MKKAGERKSAARTSRRLPAGVKRMTVELRREDGGACFFEVPFDVKAAWGRARMPVVVAIKTHRYRSTVAVYDGRYYIPVRRENRVAAGVDGGDKVQVTLTPDLAPRTVETPPDLARALAKDKHARSRWAKLSYTHQKEHVLAIVRAKRPDTRRRRLARTLELLATGEA
jgi:hypothetical protein